MFLTYWVYNFAFIFDNRQVESYSEQVKSLQAEGDELRTELSKSKQQLEETSQR
jgi:peptidoglycan hydrolase CwlO-like protein